VESIEGSRRQVIRSSGETMKPINVPIGHYFLLVFCDINSVTI